MVTYLLSTRFKRIWVGQERRIISQSYLNVKMHIADYEDLELTEIIVCGCCKEQYTQECNALWTSDQQISEVIVGPKTQMISVDIK